MTPEEESKHNFGNGDQTWSCIALLKPGDVIKHPSGGSDNDPPYIALQKDGSFLPAERAGSKFIVVNNTLNIRPNYSDQLRVWKVGKTKSS